MILCWLKIIYYKINKRLHHADTGGAPHTRAGATGENSTELSVGLDPSTREGLVLYSKIPGAPQDSIGSRKLRELIDLGLVSYPLDDDLYRARMEWLYEDHHTREIMEMESGRGCPCGGRHYPEPDACRWCSCHDPRSVHHMAGARGIMQMIKPQKLMDVRPSAEIVLCGACGHPQHTAGDRRCAFLVPPGLTLCPCDWSGILPEEKVRGVKLPEPDLEIPDPETLMDVRPSAGPAPCPRCSHPHHAFGDGRCLFLPALSDHMCGCVDPAPVEVIDTDEATDAAWDSFLGLDEDGHS